MKWASTKHIDSWTVFAMAERVKEISGINFILFANRKEANTDFRIMRRTKEGDESVHDNLNNVSLSEAWLFMLGNLTMLGEMRDLLPGDNPDVYILPQEDEGGQDDA